MAFLPMRGLEMFIADVRACNGKEEEATRVLKELAHIRSKFRSEKGLTGAKGVRGLDGDRAKKERMAPGSIHRARTSSRCNR